ncbi:hypothetical protein ACHAXR_011641 [Thalassiosira sp. AJA248-18]
MMMISRRRPSLLVLSLILFHPACTQSQEQQCDPCASTEGATTFKVRPGTACVEYVQCINGQNMGDYKCAGDTIYDQDKQYCNWPYAVECTETMCPPTREPTTDQPTISVPDCPNPCPQGYTGFQTRPGTQCKKYVSCDNGYVAEELECSGDTVYNLNARYCDWPSSYTCSAVECPERDPSQAPVEAIPDPSISESADCPNPCPIGYTGFKTRPGSQCKQYASCENGEVVNELECFGGTVFNPSAQFCDWESSTSCSATPCPDREEREPTFSPTEIPTEFPTQSPTYTQQPSVQPSRIVVTLSPTVETTLAASAPPTRRQTSRPSPQPTPRPTRVPRTPPPTTPRPTPMPSSTYQYFRTFLLEREDMINSVALQSNGSPSTAYTFPNFMNSLEIAVLQLPVDKAFFVGEGTRGRLPKLSGVEYGLVNIAAFLSNAMEEGIRIDSCDEWNTDVKFDTLPLSNGCGQYGRSYEAEECPENEPFQCALISTMEMTAVDGNIENNAPPFTCRARQFDGGQEIFPGYYDSFDDVVIQSPYANSLGRTDVEGCCWWGRGALLTRGRCSLGKLDKYLGKGAVDRGIYVYDEIDFCTNPEAICNHEKTNELRWVLGMLEWSDRVQTYDDVDAGWNYMDELKRFVDDGMVDNSFINGVTNIVKRKCHDDSCWDRWQLDGDYNVNEDIRKENFRRIIFEVFNLPMTYRPTESPSESPTFSPTRSPSITEQPTPQPTVVTDKPTRRKKGKETVKALPPNSAQHWRTYNTCNQLALVIIALFIPILFLWT